MNKLELVAFLSALDELCESENYAAVQRVIKTVLDEARTKKEKKEKKEK